MRFQLDDRIGDKGATIADACACRTNDLACFINAVHAASVGLSLQNHLPAKKNGYRVEISVFVYEVVSVAARIEVVPNDLTEIVDTTQDGTG